MNIEMSTFKVQRCPKTINGIHSIARHLIKFNFPMVGFGIACIVYGALSLYLHISYHSTTVYLQYESVISFCYFDFKVESDHERSTIIFMHISHYIYSFSLFLSFFF